MLDSIFKTIVDMNMTANIVAAIVLPIKTILQKAHFSRKVLFVLWIVIALRLISPIAPQSEISIFNIGTSFEQNTVVKTYYNVITVPDETVTITDVPVEYKSDTDKTEIFSIVWLCGTFTMLLWGTVSYISLKRKLRFAVKLKENIYISDKILSPFVFGSKIFVPENISEDDLNNIILHEKMHLKRFDNITKIIAYIVLSVHWFNPLNWIMFKLFSEDMECICDEVILAKMNECEKNSYLNTLLQSSVKRKRTKVFYNAGFSFNATKRRLKNAITVKKASKAMMVLTMCICIIIAAGTTTNAITNIVNIENPVSELFKDFPEKVILDNNQQLLENTNTDAGDFVAEQMDFSNEIIRNNNQGDLENKKTEQKVYKANEPKHLIDVPEDALKEENIKIKSDEISDLSYIGMEQIEFSLDEHIEKVILDELHKKGISESNSTQTDLKNHYLKGEYNIKDGYYERVCGVLCDENGNISFYMELNSGNFMDVTVTDSETGKQVVGFGILAGGKDAYTLLGFDKDRSYDITIKSATEDEWNLEGQYIIY